MHKHTSQNVILCDTCSGYGTQSHSELSDPHRGEYKEWNTVCRDCNGTGRLLKVVTTVTEISSYTNPEVTILLLKDTEGK